MAYCAGTRKGLICLQKSDLCIYVVSNPGVRGACHVIVAPLVARVAAEHGLPDGWGGPGAWGASRRRPASGAGAGPGSGRVPRADPVARVVPAHDPRLADLFRQPAKMRHAVLHRAVGFLAPEPAPARNLAFEDPPERLRLDRIAETERRRPLARPDARLAMRRVAARVAAILLEAAHALRGRGVLADGGYERGHAPAVVRFGAGDLFMPPNSPNRSTAEHQLVIRAPSPCDCAQYSRSRST